MSVFEEAVAALRKRQAAADEVLARDRARLGDRGDTAAVAEADYLRATDGLASQWLRLAQIEADSNRPRPPGWPAPNANS